MIRSAFHLTALLASSAVSSPLQTRQEQCSGSAISGPFLAGSFPDPTLAMFEGSWYTFGTHNGKDFQAAKSDKLSSGWKRLESDPLLQIKDVTWSAPNDEGRYALWAPDVMLRTDGKYIMYFAANDKEKMSQHCIGAAISEKVGGPYKPVNDFVQCNRTSDGVIDPAWYKDDDGKQYVVYKTEIPNNWLEIREVANSGEKEGVKWVGNAVKLLKLGGQGFDDGGNMEAPYIFKRGGIYFLTYSTHFTGDGSYDVQYATSKNVKGPYKRVEKKLLKTGSEHGCKIVGPGGASFKRYNDDPNVVKMIFHGLTDAMDINRRVVYTASVKVDGETLSIES